MGNILVIIPARGQSKGIPRKNLRPLGDRPLISYAIQTALHSKFKPDVYVSSEDEEILNTAHKLKAKIHTRDPKFSRDNTTLDPVIFSGYKEIKEIEKKKYDLVVTLQPTSPLLKTSSLDNGIQMMVDNDRIHTVISAVNNSHLSWKKVKNKFVPNYKKRINRQELPPIFKETGGLLITRTKWIASNSRIGNNVQLLELHNEEAIDIDNYDDWNLCEYYLKKKNIVFVVTGYPEVGLGHVYNSLIIANEILNHRVCFLLDKKSKLGFQKVMENNYEVYLQKSNDLAEEVIKLGPDIVVNDILDTSAAYIRKLTSNKLKVINFEDLGQGAAHADVLFNAIYPEKKALSNHYYGPEYFCAREEFLLTKAKSLQKKVRKVLITFGGVDPNNFTLKCLKAIYPYCEKSGIQIDVVVGLGYKKSKMLKQFSNVAVYQNIKNISNYMREADIVFTSAGRTTYEIAVLGTPSIILAQNTRELTHFFADETHGFKNLGLGNKVTQKEVLTVLQKLIDNFGERKKMQNRMLKKNIRGGKKKVIQIINQIIDNE